MGRIALLRFSPGVKRSDGTRSRSGTESDLHRAPAELNDHSPQDSAGSRVLVLQRMAEGWSVFGLLDPKQYSRRQ
jgi:hypothetical protein